MIITWAKSDQHLLPGWSLLRVGDTIDTTVYGIPDAIVKTWIATGFALDASQPPEPPESRYRIKVDDCTECAACIEVCPFSAISADPYAINSELCNGCGDCAEVCPVEAIEAYEWAPPEPKGRRPDKPGKPKKAKKATKEA
jgi:ferredoxin